MERHFLLASSAEMEALIEAGGWAGEPRSGIHYPKDFLKLEPSQDMNAYEGDIRYSLTSVPNSARISEERSPSNVPTCSFLFLIRGTTTRPGSSS